MKSSHLSIAVAVMLGTACWAYKAETPVDIFQSFDIYAHNWRVLADRHWGPPEGDGPYPWQQNAATLFYLKPANPDWMLTPAEAISAVLKSKQIPGLSLEGVSQVDDAYFSSLVSPLAEAPTIRVLRLAGTHVSDQSIPLINRLSGLIALSFSADMSDRGLAGLHLSHLEELEIGSAGVTDAGMHAVASMKSLHRLDLSQSRVTVQGLASVSTLPLDQLRLGSHSDDAAMATVGRMGKLGVLDLSQTAITNAGLNALVSLHLIHTLFLPKTVTDGGMSAIGKLRTLRRLDLSGTSVTDAGIRPLSTLSNLEELSLSGTEVSDESIETLLHMPKLRILDVSESRMSQMGIVQLSRLKSLQVLALTSRKTVTLADLKSLRSLPHLRTLIINGQPAGVGVLAYLQTTGVGGEKSALGFAGGSGMSWPDSTAAEALPTQQLHDRRPPMSGLREMHYLEFELDHVVPAVETPRIAPESNDSKNFLGEFNVDSKPAHKP